MQTPSSLREYDTKTYRGGNHGEIVLEEELQSLYCRVGSTHWIAKLVESNKRQFDDYNTSNRNMEGVYKQLDLRVDYS